MKFVENKTKKSAVSEKSDTARNGIILLESLFPEEGSGCHFTYFAKSVRCMSPRSANASWNANAEWSEIGV